MTSSKHKHIVRNTCLLLALPTLTLAAVLFSFYFDYNFAHATGDLTLSSGTVTIGSYTWSNYANVYVTGAVNFSAGTYSFGSANLIVQNGGTINTLSSSTTGTGATGVIINGTGNFNINSGGSINGNGLGYAGGTGSFPSNGVASNGSGEGGGGGPDSTNPFSGTGGAHGGSGGRGNNVDSVRSSAYDTYNAPVRPGSGGSGSKGSTVRTGGAGGGAIKLNTTGTVTIDGNISEDGNNVTGSGSSDYCGGAGAGGSIWINAGTITSTNNSPSISAQGGSMIIAANCGTNPGGGGGGGMIYLNSTTDTYAGSIIVAGGSGNEGGEAGTVQRDVVTPGDITIASGSTVTWTRGEHKFRQLTVQSGATITTGAAEAAPTGGRNRPPLFVGGGPYPGGSQFTGGSGGGHASSGGVGEFSGTVPGGGSDGGGSQVNAPTYMGSAGGGEYDNTLFILGGYGGGALKLTIAGTGATPTLTNNGTIKADGQNGTSGSGGGSGGSIWVNAPAGTLDGTGTFSASGGNGVANYSGGGSGGRIAFNYQTLANTFNPTITTAYGTGTNNSITPTTNANGGPGYTYGLLTSSVTSPANNSRINSIASISGTASSLVSTLSGTISSVKVSIEDTNTGLCYNGSTFSVSCDNSTTYNWLTATGTTSWSYSIASNKMTDSHAYKIVSSPNGIDTISSPSTFTFDTTAPTVTGVTSSTANGSYKAGQAISIQVNFSESVTVTGTPTLTLATGSPATTAVNYASGSGTNSLTFTYTVASGNSSSHLDYNNTSALTAGTSITDLAGNNATLTLASPGATNSLSANKNILIDTALPTSTISALCTTGTNGCTTAGAANYPSSPEQIYSLSSIAGTASDTGGSGLSSVKISIKDTTTNEWYDNVANLFNSGSEVQIATSLSSGNWTYTNSLPVTIGDSYTIYTQAFDGATNAESPKQSLSFVSANSPPTVSNIVVTPETSSGVISVTYDVTDIESTNITNYLFYGVGATLASSLSSGASSLLVSDASNFPNSGTILVNNSTTNTNDEIINYSGKSGNTLTGLSRGPSYTNSTALAHTSGETVFIKANSATGSGIGTSVKGTNKTITWTARTDANGYQNGSETIRVVANDGSSGNMLGSASNASTFYFDAKSPTSTSTSVLINGSSSAVAATSNNITLKIQNITGFPVNENIYAQFSRDNSTWYGANANGTLSSNSTSTSFASDSTTLSSLSWPWTMASRSETIYLKISDTYGNTFPTIYSNTVQYNAAPTFDTSFGTGGLSVSQISDSTDAHFGKVKIQYKVRDTDVDDTSYTPTFSYNTGSGYTTISTGLSGVTTSISTAYPASPYTVYWTPSNGIETSTASFKVLVDDGHAVNNTASATVSNLVIDTTAPTVNSAVYFDAGSVTPPASTTYDSYIYIPHVTDMSSVQYMITDDVHNAATNTNNNVWQNWTDTGGGVDKISWIFDSKDSTDSTTQGVKIITYKFRDAYGNQTSPTTTSSLSPISSASFFIQDTSNVNISPLVNQLYVSWQPLSSGTGFSSYKLEYAESSDGGSTFSAYQDVPSSSSLSVYTTNYYIHTNLNNTHFYKYRLGIRDTNNNVSLRIGESVLAKPDGTQNFGEGGGGTTYSSVVNNVVPVQDVTTKNVSVSYNLTDASLSKKTSPSYDARLFYNIGVTLGTSPYDGTSLKLSDTSKLPSSGYVQINNEVIKYTSKNNSTNKISGLTRATWPTNDSRTTRSNGTNFISGTPVWIMAQNTDNHTLTNNTISSGQSGTIDWTVYDEVNLAGSSYINVGIRVLVHDNQTTGQLSSQSDFSENGTLNPLDLTQPTVSFDNATVASTEAVTTPTVVGATLSRSYPLQISFPFTISGTASVGTNYTITPVSPMVFAAGTTTQSAQTTPLSISIVHDPLRKPNQTIILTIDSSKVTNGGNATYTNTITDIDSNPAVGFSSSTGTGDENANSSIVTIPVSLASASGGDAVIHYTTTGGTADSSYFTDTTSVPGTLTIPQGQTTGNITLHINADTTYKPSKTIVITLTSATGAILTQGQNDVYTYTVTNTNTKPVISFNSPYSSSGSESVSSVSIPVSLSNPSSSDIRVDYTADTTSNGVAPTSDYNLGSGYITISAGQTTGNISLGIISRSVVEPSRNVTLTLSAHDTNGATASLTHNIYTYTITADVNAVASMHLSSGTGEENMAGDVHITVDLSQASSTDTTINYNFSGSTATLTSDYTDTTGGQIVIPAGSINGDIIAHIVNDNIAENTKHVVVNLSSATGATISPTNNVFDYTLTDNDPNPSIGFQSSSGESFVSGSLSTIDIPVTLSGVSGKSISIDYALNNTNTTAVLGTDYTVNGSSAFSSGALTFSPGDTSKNISIQILPNNISGSDKTIEFTLSNSQNATLGTLTYDYTIKNHNDTLPPVITLNPVTVGSNTYTVSQQIQLTKNGSMFTDDFTVIDEGDGVCDTYSGSNASFATATITGCKYIVDNPVSLTNSIGTVYTITYTAKDHLNHISNATRTAIVNLAPSYSITASTDSNGTIDSDSTTQALSGYAKNGNVYTIPTISSTTGNDATFVITPNSGYLLNTISVGTNGGTAVNTVVTTTTGNPLSYTYKFTNVVDAHSINVTFVRADDKTPPTITLNQVNGQNDISLILGKDTYAEPDAVVIDNIDGDPITHNCTKVTNYPSPLQSGSCYYKITIPVPIDNTKVGDYYVNYDAEDSSGNNVVPTVQRKVSVIYADTYTISATVHGSGTISSDIGSNTSAISSTGDNIVATHSGPVYTFTPTNNTFKVTAINVNGIDLDPSLYSSSYAFSDVTKNSTIEVHFGLVNAIPPTVTLLGADPLTVNVGDVWSSVDPGATAVDSNNAPITGILETGTVNTSVPNDTPQIVTYTATDSGGVSAFVTRRVLVVDNTPPVISNIIAPITTANTIVVMWNTDDVSDGQVLYGTDPLSLTSSTDVSALKSTVHVATLSNLKESTTYYYEVRSTNTSNLTTTSPAENLAPLSVATSSSVEIVNVGGGGGSGGVLQSVFDSLNAQYKALQSQIKNQTTPPAISNVVVSNITAFGAEISFDTDEDTVGMVNFGKDTNYGRSAGDLNFGKTHTIQLTGLTTGTDYHFMPSAIDKYGNVSDSTKISDQVFKTKFFSESLPDNVTIDNIEQYQSQIEASIQSILPSLVPPFVSEPVVSDITENSATVTFKTNIKSYSMVDYASDSSFDAKKDNPYDGEVSDVANETTTHTLQINNLNSNTGYHLVAKAYFLPQVVGKSADMTFTTKASKIKASVVERKNDSFIVVWQTDEPTTSIVDYKDEKTKKTQRLTDETMSTSHAVKIENLTQGTAYQVSVSGLNSIGNTVEGLETIDTTTLVDKTPPVISNLKVDSALVTGRTDITQTIVSWQTDKPSTSDVYYQEGSGSPNAVLSNKQEDTDLVLNHVVILTTLKPSTVYRIQVSSTDGAGNIGKTPIQTTVTPTPSQSIMDLIFNNFDSTFNFVNNVK